MNKKWMLHIIAIVAFVGFLVLGLGSASGPKIGPGEASMVYFNTNGANGTVPDSVRIDKDASFTIPSGQGLSFGDATFGGWVLYDENGTATNFRVGETFKPSGGYFTFFAKWVLDVPNLEAASSFANKLIWLQNNVESNGNYTLDISANETIGPQFLSYPGKNNVTITLRGIGVNRTITFTTRQYSNVFVIGSGVTLVLDNNITLQTTHDRPFVGIGADGSLIMNNGSTITCTGDTGVEVSGGTFSMNGGTITGCRGGVVVGVTGIGVRGSGTFNMSGGTITRNNGGVFVVIGTFNMTGGTIANNTRIGDGAGVNVGFAFGNQGTATFNMSGGSITGNVSNTEVQRDGSRTLARGGGVYVDRSGRFTMTGGNITGNTAHEGANGVFATSPGGFSNRGGTVQPN